MKKALLLFGLILVLGCSSPNNSLRIATSANMQYAMEALIEAYEEEYGIKAEMIIGSSGKLTAQIKQGAPYDLFFSADERYPKTIFNEGLASRQPVIYAKGQLVLWSIQHNLLVSLDLMKKPEIKKIAIPNPEIAPYGRAAMEILEANESFNDFQVKLIYGESIAQVNQFVTTKAADLGITAKSTVVAKTEFNGNWITIPDSLYMPLYQSAVIIKSSLKQAQATSFLAFVLSDESQDILAKNGYLKAD